MKPSNEPASLITNDSEYGEEDHGIIFLAAYWTSDLVVNYCVQSVNQSVAFTDIRSCVQYNC